MGGIRDTLAKIFGGGKPVPINTTVKHMAFAKKKQSQVNVYVKSTMSWADTTEGELQNELETIETNIERRTDVGQKLRKDKKSNTELIKTFEENANRLAECYTGAGGGQANPVAPDTEATDDIAVAAKNAIRFQTGAIEDARIAHNTMTDFLEKAKTRDRNYEEQEKANSTELAELVNCRMTDEATRKSVIDVKESLAHLVTDEPPEKEGTEE